MINAPYFHGEISRAEAELRLWATGPANGAWLVRSSQSLDQRLCLSVWDSGRFFHVIVPVNRAGGFYLENPASGFSNLKDLVNFYQETGRPFTASTGEIICLVTPCLRPQWPPPQPDLSKETYCNADVFFEEEIQTRKALPKLPQVNLVVTNAPSETENDSVQQSTLEDVLLTASIATARKIASSHSAAAAVTPHACESCCNTNINSRRYHGQRLQRHNADDGLPVLLRRDDEDMTTTSTTTDENSRQNKRKGLRIFVDIFTRLLLCLSVSKKKKSNKHEYVNPAPSTGRGKKLNAAKSVHHAYEEKKFSHVGVLTVPHDSEVVKVDGGTTSKLLAAELNKPMVYADDIARILQKVQQQQHMSTGAGSSVEASSAQVIAA